MDIYIVQGSTGEYADYNEWLVRAFEDRGDAESLSDRLNKWCEDHECDKDSSTARDFNSTYGLLTPPEDPQFHNFTGVSYKIVEVPFTRKLIGAKVEV